MHGYPWQLLIIKCKLHVYITCEPSHSHAVGHVSHGENEVSAIHTNLNMNTNDG